MKIATKCIVCRKRLINGRLGCLCRVCGNSYDAMTLGDMSIRAVIERAAKRARRFEREKRA